MGRIAKECHWKIIVPYSNWPYPTFWRVSYRARPDRLARTILLDIGHFDGLTVIVLPPFDALALSLHHSPGVHAILVGSGLSRAAGIQIIKVHGEPPRRT